MMQTLESAPTFKDRWNNFFYAEERPYGLAILRFSLFTVVLTTLVRRWPYVRELYSNDGVTAPLFPNYEAYNPLPEFSGAIAAGIFSGK